MPPASQPASDKQTTLTIRGAKLRPLWGRRATHRSSPPAADGRFSSTRPAMNLAACSAVVGGASSAPSSSSIPRKYSVNLMIGTSPSPSFGSRASSFPKSSSCRHCTWCRSSSVRPHVVEPVPFPCLKERQGKGTGGDSRETQDTRQEMQCTQTEGGQVFIFVVARTHRQREAELLQQRPVHQERNRTERHCFR
eukprot:SAG22_NODE_4132_length_1374_cov_1.377255_2_plen_194_part_00